MRVLRRSSPALCLLAIAGCAAVPPPGRAASFAPYRGTTIAGVPADRYGPARAAMLCWGPVAFHQTADHRMHFEMGPFSGYGLATAVAADGYFVTAAHCTTGPRLTVLFRAAGRVWSATPRVVARGFGPGQPDVAVLKVDHPLDAVLPWAADADVRVDDPVLAVGSGLSDGPPTRTVNLAGRLTGADPAVDRPVPALRLYGDFPGRPGDSGGPVFTPAGRLVGVLTGGDEDARQCWVVRPDLAWLAAVLAVDRRTPPVGRWPARPVPVAATTAPSDRAR